MILLHQRLILLSWAWFLKLGCLLIENVTYRAQNKKPTSVCLASYGGEIVDSQAEAVKQIFFTQSFKLLKKQDSILPSLWFCEEMVSNASSAPAPLGFFFFLIIL